MVAKRYKYIGLLTFILGFSSIHALSQSMDSAAIAGEVLALGQKFRNAKTYYLEQDLKLYDSETGELLDSQTSTLFKSGRNMYSKQADQVMVAWKGQVLLVDHNEQIIKLWKQELEEPSLELEDFFKLYTSLDYKSQDDCKIYLLGLDERYLYKEVQLWSCEGNGSISKLRLVPKYPLPIEDEEHLVYLDFDYAKIEIDSRTVDLEDLASGYILQREDGLYPTPAYKNYRVVDLLN